MPRPSRKRIATAGILGTAGCLCACTLIGCYERTVRAEGELGKRQTIHEANLKDEPIPIVDDLEDLMFGPESEKD